jgi:hypothetical protein
MSFLNHMMYTILYYISQATVGGSLFQGPVSCLLEEQLFSITKPLVHGFKAYSPEYLLTVTRKPSLTVHAGRTQPVAQQQIP